MRSILIIFATIVVIALGFFAYLWFQSGSNAPTVQDMTPVAVTPASRPTELPDPDRINGAGNGENAWMRNIDEKTGLVSNEFRAAKYEPRKDGTIDVTNPEAKFYLGNTEPRQMLVVRGKRGKVFVPDSGNTKSSNNSFNKSTGTETPSHGNLKEVTLLLYNTPTDPEPNLVCTMDNASFDQETFRVYTDSFEHNGKMVAADEVPVQVRGVDYDFDGRGLDLRWNERDRRLQQLEIAHGERLVIKHPNALQQKQGGSAANGGAANPNQPTSFNSAFNLLPMLASADPTAVAMLIADASTETPTPHRVHHPAASQPTLAPVKIVRDKNAPIFRATFFDNVRIVQGDEQLATAKLMHIDFLMENSSTTQPSTEPTAETPPAAQSAELANNNEPKSISAAKKKSAATQPTASPQQEASSENSAATASASGRHHGHRAAAPTPADQNRPSRQSAAMPTSQPDEPVTIYWTGILRVTPLDAAMPDPPTKGDSIVTLLGDPVTLTHTGSRVDAASVRYRTGNSSVLMESSDTIPQVLMHDANGSIIHTPSLQYDGTTNVAVLRGASQADLVTQPPSTQPAAQNVGAAAPQNPPPQNSPPMMHATWTRTCRLFLTGDPKSNLDIDRAEIDGDVTVDHPQIKGKSDSLEMTFEPNPSTQPAVQQTVQPAVQQTASAPPSTQPSASLKNLVADGNVHYTMISQSDGKTQTIDCKNLRLETAKNDQGQTYARSINAQGGVHTYSDTQDLKCGTLALKLMPSTQPASADQQQQSDNGQMNTASTQVESMTADQNVRITSATGDTATCDRLTMDTKNGLREIVLVGEPMAHIQQKENTLNGPIIRIDPDSNRAYVVGAGTMHAIQQSSSGKPQPMDVSWTGNMDANGDTNVVNINDHVVLHSISSDGSVDNATCDRLKMILMDDPRASTQPTAQPAANSQMAQEGFGNTNFFKNKIVQTVYLNDNVVVKSVLNDAKGNLLRGLLLECQILQYDVQTKTLIIPVPGEMLLQDLGKPAAAGQNGEQPLGDMNGDTAIKWDHQMRYSDAEHHMSMDGNVHVVHQGNNSSQPFTLDSQQLTADMEPIPTTLESDQANTTAAATQTASTKPGSERMRISHVTAINQVSFVSHPLHFDASSIDYDPNTHEMIAKASDRLRAEMYDDKGEVASSFAELRYNTQTGQSSSTDLRATIAKQP